MFLHQREDVELVLGPQAIDSRWWRGSEHHTNNNDPEKGPLSGGNVEVLCGNTLFRVHTSIVSFHSPVLGQMLAKTNLAAAESPNSCPRIPSSDTATDFATPLL